MKTPLRITMTAVAALAVVFAACGSAQPPQAGSDTVAPDTTIPIVVDDVEQEPEATTTVPGPSELEALLEALIAGTDLPAVGATVFDGERIIESAVTGVRRSGDPTPVVLTDKFSIGSNTKAMTATLVATFVDEGILSWETTVEDVFGEVIPDLDEGMAQVTLRQLLNHTAGLDDERGLAVLLGIDDNLPVIEQRSAAAEITLTRPAHQPPGQFRYSNVGYTLVGAVLEQLTGTSWEELLQTRLFDALGMDSCGFYTPGTPGEVDQPWGHFTEQGGAAIDPGHPDADLPHAIAPAGLVHCSMADWAVFLQSQLRGFQHSSDGIISGDAFLALRTPPEGSDYALGWATYQTPRGVVVTHDGSNLRFTSEALLVPGEDWGALIVTNLGEEMAAATVKAVGEALVERHLAAAAGGGDEAAAATILAAGRAVAEEFLADDAAAIHAKLDSSFAAQLSVDELHAVHAELAAQAPFGGRGTDQAAEASPGAGIYEADLEWGDATLTMTIYFNDAGEISGLMLNP